MYVHTNEGGADVLFDDFRAEELAPDEAEAIRDGDPLDMPSAADDTTVEVELFADDFSRPSDRWPTGRDPSGRLGFRDGAYRISVENPSTSQQITETLGRRVPALRIDAELVQRSPCPASTATASRARQATSRSSSRSTPRPEATRCS